MKTRTLSLIAAFSLLLPFAAGAQTLTTPKGGGNQHGSTSMSIGLVTVTIDYNSPDVTSPQGQSRRGQIWGQLVPYGMPNLGFGTCQECPWRAGANENTTFSVTHDVQIEGKSLPAGTYGLHMIPGETDWTIIFSKNSTSWGSFFYDPANDALRVTVKPQEAEFTEWLTYEFTDRDPDHATVELKWEDLSIPFNINVPNINDLFLAQMKEDLKSSPGFVNQNWATAANFAVQNGYKDEALLWADTAVNDQFFGLVTFPNLMALSQAQALNDQHDEAKKTAQQALEHPTTTPGQIHGYGRQLIGQGKGEEALAAYKISQKRFGEQWPVNVSMMRGYSAVGNYKEALKYARKAHEQAPDQGNKDNLANLIEKLEKSEGVN